VPAGVNNGFQFKDNTIELKINSSYKMRTIPTADVESIIDPRIKEEKRVERAKQETRIDNAIDKFKNELLEAKKSGKIILFPNYGKRGLGFALVGSDYYRSKYDALSEWMYNEFGYYNIATKSKEDQEVLSIQDNPFELTLSIVKQYAGNNSFVKSVMNFLKNPKLLRMAGNNMAHGKFLDGFNKYVESLKEYAIAETAESSIIEEAKRNILDHIQKNKICK
jgi:hypothetical protein